MNFAIFNFRSPVGSCYSVFCHRTRLINSIKHQSHSGHVTGLFGQRTLPLTDSLSFSSELDNFGFLFSSLLSFLFVIALFATRANVTRN